MNEQDRIDYEIVTRIAMDAWFGKGVILVAPRGKIWPSITANVTRRTRIRAPHIRAVAKLPGVERLGSNFRRFCIGVRRGVSLDVFIPKAIEAAKPHLVDDDFSGAIRNSSLLRGMI